MHEIPTATLSFWPIVFLLAGGQGIFFSILLLNNKKNRPANFYLAAFIFFFSYMLIFNFCYWSNFIYQFAHFFHTNLLLNFLLGPLLLLYLDTFRKQPKLQKWWWVHFLPVLVFSFYLSPFFLQSAADKAQNLIGNQAYPTLFPSIKFIGYMGTFRVFSIYLIVYFIWKLVLYNQLIHPSETAQFTEETKNIRKNWFKISLLLYGIFLFAYLSYFLLEGKSFFTLAHDFIISSIMTFSIYAIGYIGYQQPEIFSGVILKKVFYKEKKYLNSSLTSSAANSIEKILRQLMQEKKPYLNNNLKMKDLAFQLNTSPHHLSQVINEKFNQSFNQYINTLRIQEAQRLLKDPAQQKTYLIQIAYQVGFNNKTTFNSAFKKVVGCAPSKFREQIHSTEPIPSHLKKEKGQSL